MSNSGAKVRVNSCYLGNIFHIVSHVFQNTCLSSQSDFCHVIVPLNLSSSKPSLATTFSKFLFILRFFKIVSNVQLYVHCGRDI